MRFGDLIFRQAHGVAMGMSPAPTIAKLYVAIYERDHIIPLIGSYIMCYKRFINDGFTVWLHDNNPKTDMNNCQEHLQRDGLELDLQVPPKKTDIHGHDYELRESG
jgi:hypothetical protein